MINPDYFNNPDFFVYLCKRYKMRIRIKNPIYGVPLTFLDRYNPNQFRIIDARTIALNDKQRNKSTLLIKDADSAINGKATYARICIQKI